jgi:hypothetical protein
MPRRVLLIPQIGGHFPAAKRLAGSRGCLLALEGLWVGLCTFLAVALIRRPKWVAWRRRGIVDGHALRAAIREHASAQPPVDIIEPLDVILVQLVAQLHLNDDGVGHPVVLEAMDGEDRDQYGVAQGDGPAVRAHRHGGGAGSNNPSFSPMSMALQRQTAAGDDAQSLHDITGTGIKDGPIPPGPVVPLAWAITIRRHVLDHHPANDRKRYARGYSAAGVVQTGLAS